MSYQVLARKWRPRLFREMVGQTHVLQALINALDHDRLHHAYLFTGTRGVGKTTIARILAKCLNCETGVSSEPCGVCSACREIDEGRFVDLIEVDAASRTKVEDTRELLDNVQYAPSRGRFKVYLIDEVHMLSSHSFNALLKTLEEPPAHVKFLLATTDPQKLPVTILSRCLQFSLKNMPPERVVEHLRHVLTEETIPFDEESLWLLGRAADGSMRDGLSLTDQAIAYGNGALRAEEVRSMLGTIDHGQVFALLETLAAGDGAGVLAIVAQLAEQGADFSGVLAELISTLQRLAIAQVVPDAVDNSQGDQARLLEMAERVSAEDVQLFYQLALHGRRDLPLSPTPRGGFEMALLRMLAFRPGTLADAHGQEGRSDASQSRVLTPGQSPSQVPDPERQTGKSPGSSQAKADPGEAQPASHSSVSPAVLSASTSNAASAGGGEPPVASSTREVAPVSATLPEAPAHAAAARPPAGRPLAVGTPVKPPQVEPPAEWLQMAPPDADADATDEDDPAELAQYLSDWAVGAEVMDHSAAEVEAERDEVSELPQATGVAAQWLEIMPGLGLTGLTQSIAAHCQLVSRQGDQWRLHLDPGHSALYNENHRQRLQQALTDHCGADVKLEVLIEAPTEETPAVAAARRKVARQKDAEASIQTDPLVQRLMTEFAAQICEDSIRPLDAPTT
ncbi:DNA polymerase III subunit gamma/tau [Pseudomonas sp.]|uniref:DNA polymerase III subunit gamma/tau n=1 Tax=Pseudomonas sp. TaxID=306 RepID=UPI00272D7B08|nr:DNA polymerase III subunit gamma/tau [Pseudomonas sp.]